MGADSPGFSLVSGIFQEYFSTHAVLRGNKADLAIAGTTSTVHFPLLFQCVIYLTDPGNPLPPLPRNLHPPNAVPAPPGPLRHRRPRPDRSWVSAVFVFTNRLALDSHAGRSMRHWERAAI